MRATRDESRFRIPLSSSSRLRRPVGTVPFRRHGIFRHYHQQSSLKETATRRESLFSLALALSLPFRSAAWNGLCDSPRCEETQRLMKVGMEPTHALDLGIHVISDPRVPPVHCHCLGRGSGTNSGEGRDPAAFEHGGLTASDEKVIYGDSTR
jgi:hypothetical protein